MLRLVSVAAPACRTLLCIASASLASTAQADPADYVFVPYSTAGARYIAYAAGVAHGPDGARESQQVLDLGWSPTARWFTSVYAAWAADDGARYAIDELAWLNQLQLTTPGSGPVDVGVLCELSRPHDRDEGTGLLCGPTLQLDTDGLQVNLNPLVEKHLQAQAPAAAEFVYQWQIKALVRSGLELGAQGFGDVGPWDHWRPASQQEHTLGPAVFAKWMMNDGHALTLDAAWLAGVGSGSPRDVVRLRVQHEF